MALPHPKSDCGIIDEAARVFRKGMNTGKECAKKEY
jgi:hypothetical protein